MVESPARIDETLVESFVGKAHGDLPAIEELLEREPALLNAAWDWGGGDWETALGAASHKGRRDIASFLIERGARIDIFAAAMLGHVEIVRAMLAAHPGLPSAAGPHGIPLIAHAVKGGEDAREVVELLESMAQPVD